MQAVLLGEDERGDGLGERGLDDGEAQDVAAEPESHGPGGRGRRPGHEPQRHAENGRPRAAGDDLLLQRHEHPCHAPVRTCQTTADSFFYYYQGICFALVTHAKHGEPNAGLGHDEHGALDDARRLDVPPASRTRQETANQNNETLLLLLLLEC